MNEKKYNIALQPKDYFNYYKHELKLQLILLPLLAFLGFGGYSVYLTISHFSGRFDFLAIANILVNFAIILAGIALAIALLLYICTLSAKAKFKENKHYVSGVLTINDEALRFENEMVSLKANWPAVRRAYEIKHEFIIELTPANVIVVPKSNIEQSEQEAFRSRLQTNINAVTVSADVPVADDHEFDAFIDDYEIVDDYRAERPAKADEDDVPEEENK